MRNLAVVVDRLMTVIPEDEKWLRFTLKRITGDRWKPPEQLWRMGAEAFHDRFGDVPPTDGWKKHAVDIWLGVEDEADAIDGMVVESSLDQISWRFLAVVAVFFVLGAVLVIRYG